MYILHTCKIIVSLQANLIRLYTDTDGPVEKLSTPMDPEAAQFGWMESSVRDRKTHLMTVITKAGVLMTATTAVTSQSNVTLLRRQHLQTAVLFPHMTTCSATAEKTERQPISITSFYSDAPLQGISAKLDFVP